MLENSLINTFENLPSSITLCKKNEQKETIDVPVEIVLGAVEILGGALVWIIPAPQAKILGASMVGDGIRRTFNGLEEIDKRNQTPH